MYKKKKVEISFEIVEWVDADSDDGYGNNVDEWLDHLKTLVGSLDYRAEYEIEGTNIHGDPIYGKLKSTGAKIEITDAGTLPERKVNEHGFWVWKKKMWERYGDCGYYQFKVFDTFVDVAEEFLKEHDAEVTWQ